MEFVGQLVEGMPAHQLAAQLGKKTFLLVRIMMEKDVAHHGTKNGITQVFQSLIVNEMPAIVFFPKTLVQESPLI